MPQANCSPSKTGEPSYLTNGNQIGGVSPQEAVRKRRGQATIAILRTFENEIEPLLPPGHRKAIDHFKGVCREKINGLAYEGIRAAQAQPGDSVSPLATDLAERLLADDPTED